MAKNSFRPEMSWRGLFTLPERRPAGRPSTTGNRAPLQPEKIPPRPAIAETVDSLSRSGNMLLMPQRKRQGPHDRQEE
jgi:hypothetical protein